MKNNKPIILLLIALAILAGTFLPKPWSTVVSVIILVPCMIYLIRDIVKNGTNGNDARRKDARESVFD